MIDFKSRRDRLAHPLLGLSLGLALALTAQAAETLKVAQIDPMSGPLAPTGVAVAKHIQAKFEHINAAGGMNGQKLELVVMDNEGNPEKAQVLLRQAVDSGIRYITQGTSSAIGAALGDAVDKYNRRNPEKPVMLLDHTNSDPALTGELCSYWRFSFSPRVTTRTEALLRYISTQGEVKKLFVITPDYSLGRAIETAVQAALPRLAKGVEIVGVERVPLGKVRDYAPYVAKIRASGADGVVIGLFGGDQINLMKAAKESGWNGFVYAYLAGGVGLPTALGAVGAERLVWVNDFMPSGDLAGEMAYNDEMLAKQKTDFYQMQMIYGFDLLAEAARRAKSNDVAKVAKQLDSGVTTRSMLGEVSVRGDDHQAVVPMYIGIYSDKVKRGLENTPYSYRTVARYEAKDVLPASSCKMKRPG
ncbi:MAG: ABC transporter substrate-binding protein [Burkholderiales bacterium]